MVHLYFRRHGGDDTVVMRRHETRAASMCEDCGTVVLRGQLANDPQP